MSEAVALSPYLAILLAASLPTQAWRWLGVIFAGRLDEGSELFAFVRAVATALVAAVVSKLVLFPDGALAEVPIPVRLAAAAAGFAAYLGAGRRLAVGLVVAEAVLLLGWIRLR